MDSASPEVGGNSRTWKNWFQKLVVTPRLVVARVAVVFKVLARELPKESA
jgi:hypothetical protein